MKNNKHFKDFFTCPHCGKALMRKYEFKRSINEVAGREAASKMPPETRHKKVLKGLGYTLENEYRETLVHFGYTEKNALRSCLMYPVSFGALFMLQFQPLLSKCRIAVEYKDQGHTRVIDFDPEYPASLAYSTSRPNPFSTNCQAVQAENNEKPTNELTEDQKISEDNWGKSDPEYDDAPVSSDDVFCKEYKGALKYFGYTEDDEMNSPSLINTPYGELLLLYIHPPEACCRITVNYKAVDNTMIIDFDPEHPRAIMHFTCSQKPQ